MCHSIGYQDNHMTLKMMDAFKGQDDAIANLCADNNDAVVIVPNNLTN